MAASGVEEGTKKRRKKPERWGRKQRQRVLFLNFKLRTILLFQKIAGCT